MSLILGIGYVLRFNCLFIFIRSLRKRTQFDLSFGCAKNGAPHYELLACSRNHIRAKRSTYFFNISSFTFGTGYGLEHIGFTSYFNLKYTGSVFLGAKCSREQLFGLLL